MRRLAFTLVEMLIVIIVVAVVAAIAIPRFGSSTRQSKEAQLRRNLQELRQALERCYHDTGHAPPTISALASRTRPATMYVAPHLGTGVGWTSIATPSGMKWNGPYISAIPKNPVTGTNTVGLAGQTASWIYDSIQSYNPNPIYYSSNERGLNGVAYKLW